MANEYLLGLSTHLATCRSVDSDDVCTNHRHTAISTSSWPRVLNLPFPWWRPQNRSGTPSLVNINPNHSASYHSPTPDFTPISTPPLPTWLHITNNSEDDTQVLDFAVLITRRDVMFCVIHVGGLLVAADPCSSILQGNASGLCFKQTTWNFSPAK